MRSCYYIETSEKKYLDNRINKFVCSVFRILDSEICSHQNPSKSICHDFKIIYA